MSLRVIIQPDQIENWITARQGTPARKRGTDADLQILFGPTNGNHEKLGFDELIETMRLHHLVFLVDEEPGKTFHQFVVRG